MTAKIKWVPSHSGDSHKIYYRGELEAWLPQTYCMPCTSNTSEAPVGELNRKASEIALHRLPTSKTILYVKLRPIHAPQPFNLVDVVTSAGWLKTRKRAADIALKRFAIGQEIPTEAIMWGISSWQHMDPIHNLGKEQNKESDKKQEKKTMIPFREMCAGSVAIVKAAGTRSSVITTGLTR